MSRGSAFVVTGNEPRPAASSEDEGATWPIPRLFEGVHFYWDGELLIFTEAYHRARGSCCGSGCRHCPFDHENVPSGSE